MQPRLLMYAAAFSLFGTLAGCSTMSIFKWSDDYPRASQDNPVVQMVALWQPGEGTDSDGKVTRGFAGQIYFFTNKNAAPALVDGSVRIYVFDDQGTPEEQAKPIHQFDYSAESWTASMRKGKLGPTYIAFIPYTRKGTREANCALRLRLTPKNGGAIYSEMVNVVLPGTKPKASEQKNDAAPQMTKAQPSAAQPLTGLQRQAMASRQASQDRPAMESIQDLMTAANLSAANRAQDSAKRSNAVQLTTAERERIVRETREKLEGRQRPAVKPAETEEVSVHIPASRSRKLDAVKPSGRTSDLPDVKPDTAVEELIKKPAARGPADVEDPLPDAASTDNRGPSMKTLALRLPQREMAGNGW